MALPRVPLAGLRTGALTGVFTRNHAGNHAGIRLCAALLVAALGTGCASWFAPKALPTVAEVQLDRYLGTWYEIAALPNPLQVQCVADTEAHYLRDGDQLKVINRCKRLDGATATATGTAKVVPDTGNAKLRVSFVRPFYADYWVLALDPDYRWALVGEPNREYAWILSRTPDLSVTDLSQALSRAQALGFTPGDFRATPQSLRPPADPSPAPAGHSMAPALPPTFAGQWSEWKRPQ